MTEPVVREPLPEIDPSLLPEDGELQHYWDGIGVPEAVCNGSVPPHLSDNWAAVSCPSCREVGQARQPVVPGEPGGPRDMPNT